MKFGTGRSKEKFTDLKKTVRLLSDIREQTCGNSRYIITVCHRVHCARGKKGQRQFTYQVFSCITGLNPKCCWLPFWVSS